MNFLSKITGWFKQGEAKSDQGEGKSDLQKNMEKALHMKQEAGPQANIPQHQTSHDGMKAPDDPHMSDATRGAEAGFTPQLKRSKVARSGDAS
jgi:hypothetical protein